MKIKIRINDLWENVLNIWLHGYSNSTNIQPSNQSSALTTPRKFTIWRTDYFKLLILFSLFFFRSIRQSVVDVWWEESWEEKDSNLQMQLGTSSSHVFTNSVTNPRKKNTKFHLSTFLWGGMFWLWPNYWKR